MINCLRNRKKAHRFLLVQSEASLLRWTRVLFMISILLGQHCTKNFPPRPENIVPDDPKPPSVQIVDQKEKYYPNEAIILQASLAGNEESAAFDWKLLNMEGATLTPQTSRAVFVATTPGEFVIYVRSVIGENYSDPKITNIRIDSAGKPKAIIQMSDSVMVIGKSILLNGSASTRPDSSAISYRWKSKSAGIFTDPDSSATWFTSTEIGYDIIYLRINDMSNQTSDSAIAAISVTQGSAPIIHLAPYASILDVDQAVSLDASATVDPDNHAIKFSWSSLSGGILDSTDKPVCTFKASEDGYYVIKLVVEDSWGLSSSQIIMLTVGSPSQINLPVACFVDSVLTTAINRPVLIDASCSRDPNDLPLTYHWTVLNGGVLLSTQDSPKAPFTSDVGGVFNVLLKVFNGQAYSIPQIARISVEPNKLPIANAGENIVLRIGQTALLDGSGSSDPEGQKLEFLWTALSGGSVFNSNESNASFKADQPGTYTVSLVVNDGIDDSPPDFVNIEYAANQRPVADAGNDDSTFVGVKIRLNGSNSYDPDSDRFTFQWRTLNGGNLEDSDTATPWFQADEASVYSIALQISDGDLASYLDIVNITVRDTSVSVPVANAGPNSDYFILETDSIFLDGSASYDSFGKKLNYFWQGSKRNDPQIDLRNENAPNPSFRMPLPGKYSFILTVHNGDCYSRPDEVVITIIGPKVIVSKNYPDQNDVPTTIAEGLNRAEAGDSIFVDSYKEPYRENISNFKEGITLFSIDSVNTIIEGQSSTEPTLYLHNVDYVTIKGFTIRNGGEEQESGEEILVGGVTCNNANYSKIMNNVIRDNRADGIRLVSSKGVIIANNEISANKCNGIRTTYSQFTGIGNRIEDNGKRANDGFAGVAIEGSAREGIIEIKNSIFVNNPSNHIKIQNDSEMRIENNLFEEIGGGIFVTKWGAPQLRVIRNRFINTTGAPIFVVDSLKQTDLTISSNYFKSSSALNSVKAIDIINSKGIIESDTLDSYAIGINLYSAAMLISNNLIMNNEIGIKVSGGNPPCPVLDGNTFRDNEEDLNYDDTNCEPPTQ